MNPTPGRAGSRSLWRGPALLSLLAASTLAARPASAQKVTLRWKYQQGMELVYRITNHQESYVSMGGGSTTDQTQTVRWRVTDVAPNGDATISMTTERVQIDIQGMAGNVKYDSESGEEPTDPQAKMIAALANLSYTMVVGPDGSVKSIQGMDKLRESLLAALSPEQVAMMQQIGGEMFSEESLSRMAQQNVQVFPADAVGPGDTWDRSFTMSVPMLGSMTTNTTFTLTGTEQRDGRTIAKIESTGTLTMGNDLGDTKISGGIEFDIDRGIALSSSTTTSMQMNVGAAGQQISMTMNQSLTNELVEYTAGN
jgi:hypothetical protein